MLHDIQRQIDQGVSSVLKESKERRQQYTNRCSQLGDPCERRLFYHRAAWDQSRPIEDGLAGVFRTGTALEPVIMRNLSDIGERALPPFRIVGQQSVMRDELFDAHQISGTCDGFLQVQPSLKDWHTVAVVDVKTCSPNIFTTLESIESLNRYPWTAKYKAQLMLYALANNIEWCLLLFVNKSNLWEYKAIPFPLDYEYAESLIQKADRVNAAVAQNAPPPKLNRMDECERCEFRHVCLPELESNGTLELSLDTELEELLLEREALQPSQKRWNQIDGILKKRLVPGQDLCVGKFVVTWVQKHREEKVIPAADYWQKDIKTTGDAPDAVAL